MNAIGMLLQDVTTVISKSEDAMKSKTGLSNSFQSLLQRQQSYANEVLDEQTNVDVVENIEKELYQPIHPFASIQGIDNMIDIDSINAQLVDMLNQVEEILSRITNQQDMIEAAPEMMELLQKWATLEQLFINGSKEALEDITNSLQGSYNHQDITPDKGLQAQLMALIMKADALLENQQLQPSEIERTQALLAQWTKLHERLANGNNQSSLFTDKQGNVNEHAIWQELVSIYQKRNQLLAKQQYRTDAQITSKDIAKWLGNALDGHISMEQAIGQNGLNHTVMPMSKLEQYVIFTNESTDTQSVDKQLIEQFQKVIKSSNFIKQANGNTQLSIALRPEHLGEMMVRFTQINGEMAVKIVVSSNATKEILESNIQQLRGMFSPHQIVIERQELNFDQATEVQKEQDNQPFQDHDENQTQQSEQEKRDEEIGIDFKTQFDELLMNEKV